MATKNTKQKNIDILKDAGLKVTPSKALTSSFTAKSGPRTKVGLPFSIDFGADENGKRYLFRINNNTKSALEFINVFKNVFIKNNANPKIIKCNEEK